MFKKTMTLKSFLICCVFTFVLQQTLNAQIVIGTPNLGFSQACASQEFNNYAATFVFSPETAVLASNQFSIELSDATGDFSNAIVLLTTAPGSLTVSPATLQFSIPETTAGENYRVRIKSSAPAATSAGSAPFAAYYKLQDSPFTINNLVSTGAYCTGGSYLLTIDNPGNGLNDSPLLYPSLSFNWFRETSPTTAVFISEGTTLAVTEEGTYFVETNYGSCTSNSFSNRVTISEAVTGEANATIVSSLGNPYCPEQGLTTLSTIGGISYQWFKDGNAIDGGTNQMYQTDTSGTFSVQVDLGDCSASGTINLVSELFESDINISETNTIALGETLNIIITTTANTPVFEWYLDDTLITAATANTYEATEFGSYQVVITETLGCEGSKSYFFEINETLDPFPDVANIPNVISPNGDTINDTWVLPQQYISGTNTEVIILTNQGKVVLKTNDYQNNWPENDLSLTAINQIYYYIITTSDNKTKKGAITIIQ